MYIRLPVNNLSSLSYLQDENEEETEMTLQPPKSKRGRPPKQQIVSDTSSQEQSPDRGSSSSPELSHHLCFVTIEIFLLSHLNYHYLV